MVVASNPLYNVPKLAHHVAWPDILIWVCDFSFCYSPFATMWFFSFSTDQHNPRAARSPPLALSKPSAVYFILYFDGISFLAFTGWPNHCWPTRTTPRYEISPRHFRPASSEPHNPSLPTQVVALINVLCKEFVNNTARADNRKGGLIALAAVALALSQVGGRGGGKLPVASFFLLPPLTSPSCPIGQSQENMGSYLSELVPNVLTCFGDQDARVRYFACEAMYNIAKVARQDILVYFTRVFDALSHLSCDVEPTVKSAAEMLDRLMKDIVTEHRTVNIEEFIHLLRERIFSEDPHTRQVRIASELCAMPSNC